MVQEVKHIRFSKNRKLDRGLLEKLNKVAPLIYLDPASLARQLLNKSLDEQIALLEPASAVKQSADAG